MFGHVARADPSQDHSRILRAAVNRPPVEWVDWRRRAGQPRRTWLRTIELDLRPHNLGFYTAWMRAQDRSKWRQLVETAMLTDDVIPVAHPTVQCVLESGRNRSCTDWILYVSPDPKRTSRKMAGADFFAVRMPYTQTNRDFLCKMTLKLYHCRGRPLVENAGLNRGSRWKIVWLNGNQRENSQCSAVCQRHAVMLYQYCLLT